MTVAQRFDALLASIEPGEDRLQLAAKLPDMIRKELANSTKLQTVEPHTRLVGSYRRHTAVGTIKDVDIAVLVDHGYASQLPKVVLDDLAAALDGARRRKQLGTIERHKQRRSIRCELPEHEFQIDVVPVVAVNGNPDGDLWIPDRDQSRWVGTRSIGYLATFSKLNDASGEKLVRLVKVIKYWKNQQGIDRYQAKSFWIESLIIELVRERKITFDGGWPEITQRAFAALYHRCLPVHNAARGTPFIKDPMIPGNNVAHNWTREGFETFFGKLTASSRAAASAITADEAAAVAAWRKVFGKEFAPSWTDGILPIGSVAAGIGAVFVVLRYLTKVR